jgi:hypothetical protein
MSVADALKFSKYEWVRRTEESGPEEFAWFQAADGATDSFLSLRSDGDYVSCFMAVPSDLDQEELVSLAGLTDKIIAEGDIPGGRMVVFETASTYGGVFSANLPDPAFFAGAGLPVPPALILTSTTPTP